MTPHRELGAMTMEPSVSVPMENPTRPAAVDEADPADDPLDPISRFQGLFVVPGGTHHVALSQRSHGKFGDQHHTRRCTAGQCMSRCKW